MQILIFLTLFSLPLYVVRFKIFGLPSTLLEVLIGITITYWLCTHFRNRKGLRKLVGAFKSKFFIAAAVFLLISFGSVFIGSDKVSAFGIYRAYFLEPFLLFVVIKDSFRQKETNILNALVLSGYLVSVFAIFQFFTHQPIFAAAVHEVKIGRVSSFYNSANAVALYLGPLVALLIGSWFQKKAISLYNLFSLGVFVFTILITRSFGSLLALTAVVGFYYLYYLLKNKKVLQDKLFKLFPLAILGMVVSFLIFLVFISNFTPKTGLVYPRPFDNTRIIRLCLWEGTRDLLKDDYLLGVGINNFPKIYSDYRTCDTELFQYPHNIILTFWTEVGIFGLISFMALIWVFYSEFLKSFIPNVLRLSVAGFLIYFFVHGMVDVPYFKNDLSVLFWVFLAYGLLLIDKFKATEQ